MASVWHRRATNYQVNTKDFDKNNFAGQGLPSSDWSQNLDTGLWLVNDWGPGLKHCLIRGSYCYSLLNWIKRRKGNPYFIQNNILKIL